LAAREVRRHKIRKPSPRNPLQCRLRPRKVRKGEEDPVVSRLFRPP